MSRRISLLLLFNLLMVNFGCKASKHHEIIADEAGGSAKNPAASTKPNDADGVTLPGLDAKIKNGDAADVDSSLNEPVEEGFKGFIEARQTTFPASSKSLDKTMLATKIDSYRNVFFLRKPVGGTLDPADCLDKALDGGHYKATRTSLAFDLKSEDMAACFNAKEPQGSKIMWQSAVARHYEKITCAGVDLRPFDGKRPSEITQAERSICDQAPSANKLHNTLVEYVYKVTDTAGSITVKITNIITAMNADGASCHIVNEGGKFRYDACIYTVAMLFSIVEEKGDVAAVKASLGNIYLRADGDGLIGLAGAKYYESGHFKLRLNNWSGDLTYAGATTDPTWTLQSSLDSATGIFTGVK